MPYVRPDPYHADIAYKKLLNSDPSEKELSLLVAWILCKMLSQKKLDLYIKIGDNTDEALRFIELLKTRKIASSVCLCIDKTEIDGASEAARKCFGAELTNIYLGLLNDSDKEFADASFYLPLNRIKYCTA